jgi:hypothetical protein
MICPDYDIAPDVLIMYSPAASEYAKSAEGIVRSKIPARYVWTELASIHDEEYAPNAALECYGDGVWDHLLDRREELNADVIIVLVDPPCCQPGGQIGIPQAPCDDAAPCDQPESTKAAATVRGDYLPDMDFDWWLLYQDGVGWQGVASFRTATTCPDDHNGDLRVDTEDLLIALGHGTTENILGVLASWGWCELAGESSDRALGIGAAPLDLPCYFYDYDNDGDVDGTDLFLAITYVGEDFTAEWILGLLSNWGACNG